MTHVMEHKSFRYTWELIRHTYLLDLESEIEIQQVVISPSEKDHLKSPPYEFTRYFEVEIDQIQKNGKTVSSFRNICPVEISRNTGLNFLTSLTGGGSARVTRRFQSQEGEVETRWLYTDDFFLISLSSGDRHDLSMLLSLIIGKLNMIALSIQSGRRIRSEFENQEKYRADMSSMFSEGVDGAFRDVPVYQQHGEMTGSDIDISAALMSAELQDLTAVCCGSGAGGAEESPSPVGSLPVENFAAEERAAAKDVEESTDTELIPAGSPPAEPSGSGSIPEIIYPAESAAGSDSIAEAGSPAEDAGSDSIPEISYPAERAGTEPITEVSIPAEPSGSGSIPEISYPAESVGTGSIAEAGSPAEDAGNEGTPSLREILAKINLSKEITEENPPVENIPAEMPLKESMGAGSTPEEFPPSGKTCGSCGAGLSDTTKFCGSCGASVSPASPEECSPAEKTCDNCGAGISATTKFCGSCGTAVGSTEIPPADAPASSGTPQAGTGCDASPSGNRPPVAGPVIVNLKKIEELDDLSWLSD
jgi:hypothetical protein